MSPLAWKKCASLMQKLLFPQVLPSLLAPAPARSRLAISRERMMVITVGRNEVTQLRQVVMRSCGDCVCFMRMTPIDRARRMQLCLCVQTQAVPLLMDAVMWALPQAEFGLQH